MKKSVWYRYLGTNGVIESPVHLEDTYYIRMLRLDADYGKLLTNGVKRSKAIIIPEDDLDSWSEIDQPIERADLNN